MTVRKKPRKDTAQGHRATDGSIGGSGAPPRCVLATQGPLGLLPEAEDGDDHDHQDQDHAHGRSARNQGELPMPALALCRKRAKLSAADAARGLGEQLSAHPGQRRRPRLWVAEMLGIFVWRQAHTCAGDPHWGPTRA